MGLTHTPLTHLVSDSSDIGGDVAHQSTQSAQGKPTHGESNSNSDVIMADDSNLLLYLILMIAYLCGVAPDRAWQDLVTNLVYFEKFGCPANGVSFKCLLSIKYRLIFHDDS